MSQVVIPDVSQPICLEQLRKTLSRPSLFRKLSKDSFNAQVDTILGMVRIIDFSLWLNQLSFVKNWPYGDVFHGAIAQHYGIPTNCMDVTSDLETALFFACCNYENGQWRPLRADEFAEANSRNLGKNCDARYGMPEAHRKYLSYNKDSFLSWAEPIGPFTFKTIQYFLTADKEPEQGYKYCTSLMKAADRYGQTRIEAACERVLSFSSTPTLRNILTVLKNGQDKIPLNAEPKTHVSSAKRSRGITRGADAFRKGGANA